MSDRRDRRHPSANDMGLPDRRSSRASDHGRTRLLDVISEEDLDPNPDEEAQFGDEDRRGRRDRRLTERHLTSVVREVLSEITPRPIDTGHLHLDEPNVEPSPTDTWAHVDHVQRRMGAIVSKIAHISDAEFKRLSSRFRILKWVMITVVIPLVGLLATATAYIYSKGYDAGAAAGWQRSVEQRLDRLEGRAAGPGRTP